MTGTIKGSFVSVFLIVLTLLFLSKGLIPDTSALADGPVAFDQDSYLPGSIVVFHIQDGDLATTEACTGAWTDAAPPIPAQTWWSFPTGAPQPEVYQGLDDGCIYDRETPANTPLTWPPQAEVKVNGTPHYLSDVSVETGEFQLANDLIATSTVVVLFRFEVADTYPASERRAKVTSAIDPDGEWVAISEVVSQADASPHPTSGLFRGEVLLDTDEATSNPGDGVVRVRHDGDTLTVTYFDANGQVIASDTIDVEAITPIPATSTLALVLMAGLFTLVIAWRLRRSRSTLGAA